AYAKPFRQGHKNDFRDAYAVAEAVQRPSTRCVPVKTADQLDLQALHRVRSRLIGNRTAVINPASRLSIGARHSGAARTSLPATAAATNPGYAKRCALAAYGQDHRGAHWRLDVSR